MKFTQDTAAQAANATGERGSQQARDERVEVVRAADLREEPRPARMRQGRTADGGVRAADVVVVAFRDAAKVFNRRERRRASLGVHKDDRRPLVVVQLRKTLLDAPVVRNRQVCARAEFADGALVA